MERASLRERIAELASAGKEAAESATETQRTRLELQTEITSLREELGRREQALREIQATFNGVEENLRNQILSLEMQLTETHHLLEDRNDELLNAKSEMDALLERMALLESDKNYNVSGNEGEQGPDASTRDPAPEFGEKPISVDSRDWDFLLGEPSAKTMQKEKFGKLQELVDTIKSDPEQPHNAPRGGRWRSISQWKRRWKT